MKPLKVFVVQPFCATYSEKFYEMIKEVCESFNGEFIAFRADSEPSRVGPILQFRIDSYLKNADICVADLTGTRNQNALLEVGAAYTLNIPVIPVSDKELPSDIGGNLYINLNIDKIGNNDSEESFKKQLALRLKEASSGLQGYHRDKFIVYGYKRREMVDFYSYVQRCQERICILTTNLGFLVRRKLSLITNERKTLLEMIADSLENKPIDFHIRILALDPDSNYTNERASALGRDRREFREHMRNDLNTLKEFVESDKCAAEVQVKTYDAYPLQMTYFFDDKIVSSVVATGRSSRDCITYVHSLLEDGGKETYDEHFLQLWGKGVLYATSTVDK